MSEIIDNLSENDMKLLGVGDINFDSDDHLDLCDIFIPKREDSKQA